MDPTPFTNPLGTLLPVEINGVADHAFLPAPLPDEVALDEPCWVALARFSQAAGRLIGLQQAGRIDVDPGILERALSRREAVHSSRIEGTIVSPEAVALYDTQPIEPTNRTDTANDLREVANLRAALRAGESLGSAGVFTADDLCALHCALFTGVLGLRFSPGELREQQVYLGIARRFVPPPPERVRALLDDWTAWTERATATHPAVRALLAHYQLETVHPFADGNGRVGRAALSLSLASWLGLDRPWIAPSAAIERHKEEYVARLFGASAESDLTGWIAFGLDRLAEACDESFEILRDLADQLALWEETALDAGMKPRVRALLRHLLGTPVTDIARAADVMGCAYNTAKADLEKLEALNILAETPRDDRKAYIAPSVIRIVHNRE